VSDSQQFKAKVDLRLKLLRQYAEAGHKLNVMDCCAGKRAIWKQIGQKVDLDSYMGFDIMASEVNNIICDSIRWLKDVGISGNVVDVDTYGLPWTHYRAIYQAKWPESEILVFLTASLGCESGLTTGELEAIGIPDDWRGQLPTISWELRDAVVAACIHSCREGAVRVKSGSMVTLSGNSSRDYYMGLWLERVDEDCMLSSQ